ncbi:MAG: hypothetical protein WAM91_09320 [Candidatus Acidiferrales bacterium]
MANESRRNEVANPRENSAGMPSSGAAILMAAAGLMILLVLMAQFGELGLGPFTRDTFWIIPFLTHGLWTILVGLLSRTALAEASPLWPLMFVLGGCAAIFLLSSRTGTSAQDSSRGSDRGR